jgi:outer membrane protein TolC
LQQSALVLSLFYRDANGKPLMVAAPDKASLEAVFAARFTSEKPVEETKLRAEDRPDVYALSRQLLISDVAIENFRNRFLPKLDFAIDYTRNIGYPDPTNAPNVLTMLLNIEVPIERNLLRGQLNEARAQRLALQTEYDFRIETARVEVASLEEAILRASMQMRNARQEIVYASQLLEAENYRFTKGGSNFFLINLREEARAQAEENYLGAAFSYVQASAEHRAATAQYKHD